MFSAFDEVSTDTIRAFDKMGFSSEELNSIWEKSAKQSKLLGKDTFTNLLKNINKDADAQENRRQIYAELIKNEREYAAALSAKKGTDEYNGWIEQRKKLEQELADAIEYRDEKDKDSSGWTERNKEVERIAGELQGLNSQIEEVDNAAINSQASIQQYAELLDTISASEASDEITKLTSAMERMAKVTDLTKLSVRIW